MFRSVMKTLRGWWEVNTTLAQIMKASNFSSWRFRMGCNFIRVAKVEDKFIVLTCVDTTGLRLDHFNRRRWRLVAKNSRVLYSASSKFDTPPLNKVLIDDEHEADKLCNEYFDDLLRVYNSKQERPMSIYKKIEKEARK